MVGANTLGLLGMETGEICWIDIKRGQRRERGQGKTNRETGVGSLWLRKVPAPRRAGYLVDLCCFADFSCIETLYLLLSIVNIIAVEEFSLFCHNCGKFWSL